MDREYAFRTLQVQYTFSVREYTHREKVFSSLTEAKQFASYRRVPAELAADQGLEPQYHPPEGCVLPLDESAINICIIT